MNQIHWFSVNKIGSPHLQNEGQFFQVQMNELIHPWPYRYLVWSGPDLSRQVALWAWTDLYWDGYIWIPRQSVYYHNDVSVSVNSLQLSTAIQCPCSCSSLVQVMPDGTKPLSEPMLTYHRHRPVTIIWRKFYREIPQPSITKISLKIT